MYSIDVDIFSIQYVYNIQLARLFEGHWAACGIAYFVNKKERLFIHLILIVMLYYLNKLLYLSFNKNLKFYAFKAVAVFPCGIKNGIEYRYFLSYQGYKFQ